MKAPALGALVRLNFPPRLSALACLSALALGALACAPPGPPASPAGGPEPAAGSAARPTAKASAAPAPIAALMAAFARRSEANAAYDAKDYRRSAALFVQASELDPVGADDDDYNAACALSLGGDKAGALDALERGVGRGLRDRASLERDDDLKALRDDPRWARVLAGVQANAEAHLKGANPELRRLHDEDQADRHGGPSGIDWNVVGPRDAARRKRVREILDAGGAKTAADYYHAAMVFQHGSEVADFRTAHELSKKAAELDPTHRRAIWLAAASKDRELMNQGKPQLYGTQFRRPSAGAPWELYQVDPSITDEERARWRTPPLAEAKRRAEAMNARR